MIIFQEDKKMMFKFIQEYAGMVEVFYKEKIITTKE